MGSSAHHIDPDQLSELLKARNPEALEILYRDYSSALYGVISRIVPDQELANEVLQDAFLRIWQKADTYDPEKGRLFTWMFNIARNLAIDKLRSAEMRRKEKTASMSGFVSDIEEQGTREKIGDNLGVRELLDDLREEERFVVEKLYFGGLSQAELSKEYDIPLGTVKTRLRMALKHFRKMMKVI